MEAVETNTNNKRGTKPSTDNGNAQQARTPRKRREPPRAYKQDELKESAFPKPKVAQRGISIDKLAPGDVFAMTSDGESLNVKISKSQSRRVGSRELFDSAGMTVYEYVGF
jgi:hypothetical protein